MQNMHEILIPGTFAGTAIHYKVKKSKSIFASTTDEEIYSTYDGVKCLQPL